jgi:hypothetical protein
MTRLTFAGAIFLTLIAILPSLLSQGLHVPTITAQFFGGTSLLIIVGVILDTMRQGGDASHPAPLRRLSAQRAAFVGGPLTAPPTIEEKPPSRAL